MEASNIFRKAAGVFQHLEERILPPFQPRLPPERPPEVTTSMAKIWGILCLAEAQVRIPRPDLALYNPICRLVWVIDQDSLDCLATFVLVCCVGFVQK